MKQRSDAVMTQIILHFFTFANEVLRHYKKGKVVILAQKAFAEEYVAEHIVLTAKAIKDVMLITNDRKNMKEWVLLYDADVAEARKLKDYEVKEWRKDAKKAKKLKQLGLVFV